MDLATLQRMHPTWNVVSFQTAPNGGIWALGSDGGVFALDATGGTTGLTAPYLGSYTGLAPNQRQGTRNFVRLDVNPSGGYTLVSNNQEQYRFDAPPPAPPTPAAPVNTAGTIQATDTTPAQTAGDVSGTAAIRAVLEPLGLGALADQALNALHSTPGASPDYITQVWLPQQDTFKKAFPEITFAQDQVSKGLAVHIPTPGEIVQYRQTAKTMADQGLIPPEFVTNDQVTKLINGGVSVGEFQSRVLNAVDTLTNADPATRDAFFAYHPAVDFSHAVGALLDPTLNEAAVKRAVAQAEVGGAAARSGFGNISATQASTLAGLGQGSQSQFTNLALQHPLTQNLIGEQGNVSTDTQLATLTGNAAAISDIERRRQARQGAFAGGGGAGAGGTGSQGIGSAG